MDTETQQELLDSFNRGLTGSEDFTPLQQLRASWAMATNQEREIFKAEILSRI